MAHHLVTQVEEPDEDNMSLTRSSHPSSVSGSTNGQLMQQQQQSYHPYAAGCWRTFWSFFCASGKKQPPLLNHSNSHSPNPSAPIPLSAAQNGAGAGSSSSVPRPIHSTTFQKFLLSPLPPDATIETIRKCKCLVLDLDETLVHSSFKPIPNPDFVLTIELDGVSHKVFVRKRPGVDYFLRYVAARFEVVVFTASLSKYADPLLDILDPERLISARLFRESCVQHYGNFVKDLTHLGRPLHHTLIVDNSPFSYMFQPESAVPCTSWFSDKSDMQLYEMLPFLDLIVESDNVVQTIHQGKMSQKYSFFGAVNPNVAHNSGAQWQQHHQQHQQEREQQMLLATQSQSSQHSSTCGSDDREESQSRNQAVDLIQVSVST